MQLKRTLVFAFALLVIGTTAWMLPACAADDASATGTLGQVGDKTFTEKDILDAAGEQMEQVEMQLQQCKVNYKRSRHEVMESTLQELLNQELLNRAAEARGISTAELLQQEIEEKIPEVTDADVDAFYTENQARIRQPKENVAAQIRAHLQNLARQERTDAFYGSLSEGVEVANNLGPYRAEVDGGDAPFKGPANAPITIVEFSDFECPFCSRVNPTLQQVMDTYGDKVKIYFRHYPLNFHENAQKASEAAMCAHDQGKFWEMHDLLFAEQQQLGIDQLKNKAERLGLDLTAFGECLDGDKYAQLVQDDLREGSLAGVSGTPGFFINGRLISGAQPFTAFQEVIDEELARAGASE